MARERAGARSGLWSVHADAAQGRLEPRRWAHGASRWRARDGDVSPDGELRHHGRRPAVGVDAAADLHLRRHDPSPRRDADACYARHRADPRVALSKARAWRRLPLRVDHISRVRLPDGRDTHGARDVSWSRGITHHRLRVAY